MAKNDWERFVSPEWRKRLERLYEEERHMEGIPIVVQQAAARVLEIEGVEGVKIVPPVGVYTIHALLKQHDLDGTQAFYKVVLGLEAFASGSVDIQSESEASFKWVEGMLVEKDDGRADTDLDVSGSDAGDVGTPPRLRRGGDAVPKPHPDDSPSGD